MESITNLPRIVRKDRKKQKDRKKPQKDHAKQHKKTSNKTGAKKSWAAHRVLFRATQQLYKTSQLAREILGALTSSDSPLSKEELEAWFREKLLTPNQKSNINKYAPYTGEVDDGSLMKLIEGAKHNCKDLAVVFVDLVKAFDSVGHKLRLKALQRVQLPKAFVGLIKDLYTGSTTVVEGNGNCTTPIDIERDVKQGNPFTPILLNIALNPLVCSVERANSGVSMPLGGRRVNCSTLAIVDDIALLNDSHNGMARNLKLLQSYCDHTGLRINITMTDGFHFMFKKKTFLYNHFVNWKLRNESKAYIPPGDTEKYLGARTDL
ncbi:hypothetical protein chiPu_0009945 [Chiloscyllium punctatum]|uniref:Reverse transcriptase domain-containing protein n=1 Tax=Chiloscyllium punctatum TaxID=137246 RepID=A0A401SM62_CHIPU|nr:hypothetical protein [Chiloscyllium punctatum]